MANPPPDRQVNSVPYPRTRLLTENELFDSSSGLPSIHRLTKHLQEEGLLDERCALRLIELARQIFEHEPNMLIVKRPVTIVADIHGQFYDLLTILSAGGDPATTHYLFLGDYVDRGQFECECIFLLFALKINYPQNINLLRGYVYLSKIFDFILK
jgi:serine/threonine-protein phosphatase 2B catalytic subunit